MNPKIIISREELYRKIWSVPSIQLAKEFGISDVALNKKCKRFGIPTPGRGYWAQFTTGKEPRQTPLPPALRGQSKQIEFDTLPSLRQKAEWRKSVAPKSGTTPDGIENPIKLNLPDGDLHPIARRAQLALQKTKQGEDGWCEVREKDLPFIRASASIHDRVAVVIDALLRELEDKDIRFEANDDKWRPGLRFVRGPDWLSLSIEELPLKTEREPTPEDKLKPSSTWQLTTIKPSGMLSFSLGTGRALTGRKHWSETGRHRVEDAIYAVVLRMAQCFDSFEREREAAAERDRQWAEERRLREETHKVQEHQRALDKVARERDSNLVKASQWWMIYRDLSSFIEECERRWHLDSPEGLSAARSSWLDWARERLEDLSPFSAGYPNPELDGLFNAASFPAGGPLPTFRDIPAPPHSQTSEPQSYTPIHHYAPAPSSKPYPFWLRNRRH